MNCDLNVKKGDCIEFKNLEENESISINRSILDTWNFITDINNQKLLCSNQNVTVKKQGENKLDIIDNDTKCLSTFLITKNGDNEDKKQYNGHFGIK